MFFGKTRMFCSELLIQICAVNELHNVVNLLLKQVVDRLMVCGAPVNQGSVSGRLTFHLPKIQYKNDGDLIRLIGG